MSDSRAFTSASPRQQAPELDLHAVSPAHYRMHARLENWARYVRETSRRGSPAPMFRYYRPYSWPRQGSGLPTVDALDAATIERAVAILPDDPAYAVRWCYVFPWRDERKVCRILEVDRVGLHELIESGRALLIERLRFQNIPL